MKTGIELIAEERQRQIEVEGWTPEHDAEHTDDSIACAAACYAFPQKHRPGCNAFRVAANVLRLCVCLPLAQSFKLPQMLMGQIAQNRC